MRYAEPTAELRRIAFRLEDSNGDPIEDALVDLAGPNAIRVSKSGAMLTAGLGSLTEVGDGDYLYEATLLEATTLSFLALRVNIADLPRPVMIVTDIGNRVVVGEDDAAARRTPIYLIDGDRLEVPNLDLDGAISIACPSNGYVYTASAGTWGQAGNGLYYVEHTLGELSASESLVGGPVLVSVSHASARAYVYTFDLREDPMILTDEDVSAIAARILDTVIEGPDQYDDAGEDLPPGGDADDYNVTVAQAIRELLAFTSNNWTGGDGPTAVMKSRVGGRNRLVASLVNGNRTVTSRNHD